jgi:Mg/Co/Ni transporter MgtE
VLSYTPDSLNKLQPSSLARNAKDLISPRVIEGMAEERLINVAGRIRQRQAHYCVVLASPTRYLGLIGLKEIAGLSNPGNRILADLVDGNPAQIFAWDTPAADVADLFERAGLQEAVVLGPDNDYLGIITLDRLFLWANSGLRALQAGQ